ncbi:hypothetical protein BUE80_DR011991 [Diplocarpon rosae]|nr:hypothetical protein BUE80_DR011991 [Diplocarpon rosae]
MKLSTVALITIHAVAANAITIRCGDPVALPPSISCPADTQSLCCGGGEVSGTEVRTGCLQPDGESTLDNPCDAGTIYCCN